jgi:hypothetical protein
MKLLRGLNNVSQTRQMTTLALHLEFKVDGALGPSGPGDTLRLVHALRRPESSVQAIATAAPDSLRDLVPSHINLLPVPVTTKETRSGSVRPEGLIRALEPHIHEYDEVVHAFIGHEYVKPGDPIAMTERIERRRVDGTGRTQSWMYHGRWMPQELGDRQGQRVLAAVVRAMPTAPHLNTPSWFIEEVRDVAQSLGWRILWVGGRRAPPEGVLLGGSEEYLPYDRLSIGEQISEIRGRAAAGVGWNSGGLDLVSAAGCPVLRIGEYQKHFPNSPDGSRRPWGATYNSFLAVATNIGLAPQHMGVNGLRRDVVRQSMEVFLDRALTEIALEPRHVIMPPGYVLDTSLFEQDMQAYEVRWPG